MPVSPHGCVSDSIFNISATAGFYSQLSGVLAGFAFAAVPLSLQDRGARADGDDASARNEASDQWRGRYLVAFLCAFFSLILTAIIYSILAGTDSTYPAASVFEVCGGIAFTLSILTVLHGVTILLRAASVSAARVFGVLTCALAPPLAMVNFAAGVSDFQSALRSCGETTYPNLVLYLGYVPALLLVACAGWGILRGRIPSVPYVLTSRGMSLTAVVVTVAASIVASALGQGFVAPEWTALLVSLLFALYLLWWQISFMAEQQLTRRTRGSWGLLERGQQGAGNGQPDRIVSAKLRELDSE